MATAERERSTVAEAVALGLTAEEFERICALHGRVPNRLELGIYSLLWSEHCSYKHSRRLLSLLPTIGENLVAGVGENAGVVRLGRDLYCAFKVESHNHPSAVEPFEGAATGVGGILRDIVAVGARPVAVLDLLRFGDPASPRSRYLLDGAVRGIAHYGNSVGVPTVGGELYFDPGYEQNCLVNVLAVGLIEGRPPASSAAKGVGNLLYLFGARTGRDGIGGASVLASAALEEDGQSMRPSVQVSDPFEGNKLIDCLLDLLEQGLAVAVQDLGAAGLSSACAEMAAKGGVGLALELDRVPLREELAPFEIMLSESQERFAAIVSPDKAPAVEALCARHEVLATQLGEVIEEPVLLLRSHGEVVGEVPVGALVEGAGRYRLKARRPAASSEQGALPSGTAQELVVRLLGSPNIASREPVFGQYDWAVQGRTVVGPAGGDGALLALPDGRGLAVTLDGPGPLAGEAPREAAVATVLEAAANLAVRGATPVGLTNNLNFADPEQPEVAWQLAEAVRGLAEGCRALGIPVVGGNVSLYNASPAGPIPPTPVVGMVGVAKQLRPTAAAFPGPGLKLALFGPFHPSLRGSELERLVGVRLAGGVELPNLARAREAIEAVAELVCSGGIFAHDLSRGGLAVALARCAASGIGATVSLSGLADLAAQAGEGELGWWSVLFGEGQTGFLVGGEPQQLEELACFGPLWPLGETGGERLVVAGEGAGERFAVDLPIGELAEALGRLAGLFD